MLIIAIKKEKHSKEAQETLGAYKKNQPTTNTKWIQLNSTNDTSGTHCVK